MSILTISYITLSTLVIGILIFLISKKIHRKYFLETLKLRLLSVKLPQRLETESKEEPLKEINLSAQLLSALGNLKIPF